jgi:hypothetical protein
VSYVFESSGLPLVLGARIGGGGAGDVYHIQGQATLCVKIYNSAATAAAAEPKVRAMLANPPDNVSALTRAGTVVVQMTWPQEAVLQNGRFVGFVMPLIDKSRSWPTFELAQPVFRAKNNLPEHLRFRLLVALNLALVLQGLHLKGHRMIDLKPDNVRVYRWNPSNKHDQPASGYVVLLDTDGFSIARGNGQRFPADMTTDNYRLPPAIKPDGSWDSAVINNHGVEQDIFAFSVMAFELLNSALKPIDAVEQAGRSILADTDRDRWMRMERRTYAYGAGGGAQVKAPAHSMHGEFSPKLRDLFDRSFLTPTNPAPLSEWIAELKRLFESQSNACAVNEFHWKLGDTCGACAAEKRLKASTVAPKPAAPAQPAQQYRAPPPRSVQTAMRPSPTFVQSPKHFRALWTVVPAGILTGIACLILPSGMRLALGTAPSGLVFAIAALLAFMFVRRGVEKAGKFSSPAARPFAVKAFALSLAFFGHLAVAGATVLGVGMYAERFRSGQPEATTGVAEDVGAPAPPVADEPTYAVVAYSLPQVMRISRPNVNIRVKPMVTDSSAVLSRAAADDRFRVVGKAENSLGETWYEVERLSDQLRGFVLAKLLVPVSQSGAEAATEAAPAAPEDQPFSPSPPSAAPPPKEPGAKKDEPDLGLY